MDDTKFVDCSGLSDDGYSSAYDVALMSRALMRYSDITRYTTIWMDSLRGGKSQLVNTNKLVRFYSGITGLKTGTTSTAGTICPATAERDGLRLAAVILGCSTTADRFDGARENAGLRFCQLRRIYFPLSREAELTPVKVLRGTAPTVEVTADPPQSLLVKRGRKRVSKRQWSCPPMWRGSGLCGSGGGHGNAEFGRPAAGRLQHSRQDGGPRMTVGTAYGRLLTALIAQPAMFRIPSPHTASLHNGESPAPSKGIHK